RAVDEFPRIVEGTGAAPDGPGGRGTDSRPAPAPVRPAPRQPRLAATIPRLPVARLAAPLGTARGGPHLPAADPPPAVVAQLIAAGQGGGRPAPRRRRLPAARLAGGGAGAKAGLSSGGVPRPPGGRVRPGRADPQRPGEVGPRLPRAGRRGHGRTGAAQ